MSKNDGRPARRIVRNPLPKELKAVNACIRAMDDLGPSELSYLATRFLDAREEITKAANRSDDENEAAAAQGV